MRPLSTSWAEGKGTNLNCQIPKTSENSENLALSRSNYTFKRDWTINATDERRAMLVANGRLPHYLMILWRHLGGSSPGWFEQRKSDSTVLWWSVEQCMVLSCDVLDL